jgi:hypothetical protein
MPPPSGRPISCQLRLLIRFAPANRIYFELLGSGFVFVPEQRDRLVYGQCTFENESRFWKIRIDGATDRNFVRVKLADLECYKKEILEYLDFIKQAGSVRLM